MVNPLYGYISRDGRLFQEIDDVGIETYRNRGFFDKVFDFVLGKTLHVSYAGDTVIVDRESAERFFSRNKDLLEECGEADLCQKVLFLLNRRERLPHGVLAENTVGGEEAKSSLIGAKRHFMSLARALQKNAFEVEHLLKIIHQKEENMISLERERVFRHIIEENKSRLDLLQSTCGDDTVKKLAEYLIKQIRQEFL